ncbi:MULTISPECIES: 4Fe-4S binding protein [Methanobrevibacter]|uniref:4Fe-4S binding protein n=1 Tax=Methanobrevibacter TaxID=2172 RepID=UPI0025D15D07|nr:MULTISPECIES: 4Fe-4S binding protein [Methanobrevibacter]
MSSLMWYIYDFARKAWASAFTDAKTNPEIAEKPERFRDFPKVNKEFCIGCGACTVSCPSPHAIKIVREMDDESGEGSTYPIINPSSCIRCGFCAEVCPTDPKTLECGLNHLILPEFNLIPSKRQFIVDDYLCIKCKKCLKNCPVDAIGQEDGKIVVDQLKCIYCSDCLDVCPVNGAMKGVFVDNLQDQKELILLCVNYLEDFINSKEDDLRSLEHNGLLQYDVSISEIMDDALKIIPDREVSFEIMSNAVNRLKIRVIDWDKSKCEKCQLCIPDCPTSCISFDDDKDTIVRDKSRCLRCSICYQTCPFSVIKYFMAKFACDDENIHIIVKASNLNEDIVE